jgi:hypothetical protein
VFPGPHDELYYNEVGEPIGWDAPADPEFCNNCGQFGHNELNCPYADVDFDGI